MAITIDRDKCEGYGMCAQAAPSLIELDDEGDPQIADSALAHTDESTAERAARACPIAAVLLT